MLDQQHTKQITLEFGNRSTAQVIVETGTLIIIAMVALIGNSCVLYVFFKSPRFRSVTNYYLISLAISDILFSLINMPLMIMNASCGRDVIGSSLIGNLAGFLGYSFLSGSLQTTMLIAVNRFFCIVKPKTYRKYFKPKPALLMVVGIWVFSVFTVGCVFLSGIATFEFYPGRFGYFLAFQDHITEMISSFAILILFGIIPATIAIISYWKIYKTVEGHQNSVASSLNTVPATNRFTLTREEIRITRSVLALVCGFVICWFPYGILLIISVFQNIPRRAEMVITYSASLSTAINPIIFNVFDKSFRREGLSIFCGNRLARVGSLESDQ